MTDPKVWASCSKEVLKKAAPQLLALGFKRTKPTLFTREREHWCDFVHVHRFTGGRHYRLHAGIRVFNSTFPACDLNGPQSTPENRRLILWFVNNPDSLTRCAGEFPKFVTLVAEPWFGGLSNSDALLARISPLSQDDKSALRESLAGRAVPENIACSRKLLGLK